MSEHTTASVAQHPVLAALACVEGALADVAGVQPVFMSTVEKAEALLVAARVEARLAELQLRVLAASEDVAAANGMRNPGSWLAHRVRLGRGEGARRWRLARGLDGPCPQVARGMREGVVSAAQANVIVDAVAALPEELSVEVRLLAEQHLVEQARHFDPAGLERLGRKVLEVVAPDHADEHERRLIEAAERRAARRTFLRFRRNGDGTTDIHARVSDQVAHRLRTYVEAFTNPRRPTDDTDDTDETDGPIDTDDTDTDDTNETDAATETDETDETDAVTPDEPPDEPASEPTESSGVSGVSGASRSSGASGPSSGPSGSGDLRPYSERLGAAFASLLEHLDPRRLPLHGGDATTVVVTIDHEVLSGQLAGLGLIGEEPISPGESRRLACVAKILPVVLGGKSEVLDLGRASRLASAAQRRARALIDKTCRGEGCDIPAAWCECHHLCPWSHGGRTDLNDLRLLCSHHHHLAHDDHYDMLETPDGRYRFRRRQT